MARPILVQHHPRHRPARPLAPMRAATLGLLQKTLRIQKRLRPSVAPGEMMASHQLLVKVFGREALVALAIQCLHLVLPVGPNLFARRFAKPPIQEPGFAIILEPLSPSLKCPLVDPQRLKILVNLITRTPCRVSDRRILDPHLGPNSTGQIICYRHSTARPLGGPTLRNRTWTRPVSTLSPPLGGARASSWFVALVIITPLLEPTAGVVVLAPMGAITALPEGGAALMAPLGPFTRLRGERPGFVARLYAQGAILALLFPAGGCGACARGASPAG